MSDLALCQVSPFIYSQMHFLPQAVTCRCISVRYSTLKLIYSMGKRLSGQPASMLPGMQQCWPHLPAGLHQLAYIHPGTTVLLPLLPSQQPACSQLMHFDGCRVVCNLLGCLVIRVCPLATGLDLPLIQFRQ